MGNSNSKDIKSKNDKCEKPAAPEPVITRSNTEICSSTGRYFDKVNCKWNIITNCTPIDNSTTSTPIDKTSSACVKPSAPEPVITKSNTETCSSTATDFDEINCKWNIITNCTPIDNSTIPDSEMSQPDDNTVINNNIQTKSISYNIIFIVVGILLAIIFLTIIIRINNTSLFKYLTTHNN